MRELTGVATSLMVGLTIVSLGFALFLGAVWLLIKLWYIVCTVAVFAYCYWVGKDFKR